ncbi:MAG: CapA family protein [Candidatus Dormiibacterota bacterium]
MASGDSMITRRLFHNPDPRFQRLVELIRSGDAAFTNFEMGCPHDPIVPNVNHPSAFQYSKPFVLDELKACGFNLIGTGNNHVADYGPKGLMDLLEEIERRDLVSAGAGGSLGEAQAPGYLDTPGGRIALLAVTATNVEHSMAVARRPDMNGRPGVNPLRFDIEYHLEGRLFEALGEIDEALGTAAASRHRGEFAALTGHSRRDAVNFLGGSFFKGEVSNVVTKPREGDMKALTRAIEAARAQADVVVGSGPHMLRRIEIYNRKPIFISLGSFVFEIETLQRQPAPAYEKHGLPPQALPADVTAEVGAIRSGSPRGFWDRRFWTGAVAECKFEGREVREVNLYPIDLGMENERWVRGAPVLADAEVGLSVLENLRQLSQEAGVEIATESCHDSVVGRVRL